MSGDEFSRDSFEKYSTASYTDDNNEQHDGVGEFEISFSSTETSETCANNNNDDITRRILSIDRNFPRDEYLNITR